MNRALKYILLIIVSGIFLFPILWVIISSFKPQSELFTYPLTILPHKATIENYVNAFASGDFITYYANSIFVSVAATLLTITINVMAGYALSKFYFKGRDLIFYIMISTLMIPLQAIMIPIFLLLKELGLLNSLWESSFLLLQLRPVYFLPVNTFRQFQIRISRRHGWMAQANCAFF